MKKVKVTKREKTFIDTLINGLYAEEDFSDVEVTDIAEEMGLSVNICKGILGSLTVKELVKPAEYSEFGYIHLSPSLYCYHPEWKKEYLYGSEADSEDIELITI